MSTSTNGWDAVFAMNTVQINAILFQHYLQEGPTRRTSALRFVVTTSQPNQFYVFDAKLGPPEINLEKSTLQMFILSGMLFLVDAGQIDWVLPIAPDSLLSGTLHFDKVEGKDVAGNVVLNLAAAALEPSISGVDPKSTLPSLLTDAIAAYYKSNATQIPLGTIVTGDLTPALRPTTFHFYTQQKANSDETCLVLFIQTNGKDGKIAPLDSYPLTGSNSVALRLSDAVIFGGVVPLSSDTGLSMAGKQDGASWCTTASGTVNAGEFGDPDMIPFVGYSSDRYGNFAPVIVTVDGLKLAAENGSLTGKWQTTWTQYWIGAWGFPHHCDMTASFSLSNSPQVDPDTCVVSFKGNANVGVSGGDDFWNFFSTDRLGVQDTIYESLKPLEALKLVQVNTFALANLIFPSGHRVRLSSVALPGDLVLGGTMVVPFAVHPDRANLAPGATQQFSVDGGKSVSWSIETGGVGTISATGLYTAPAQVSQTKVVTIQARNNDDLNKIGRAMVVIEPPKPKTGITVSPGKLKVTAGKSVALTVTNETGTPIDANLSLSPEGIGALTAGLSTGQWTYVSPAQVHDSASVRIVAKAADKSGEATFTLTPSAAISITPQAANVAAGGSARFTAKGADDLTWMAWPVGTVSADETGAAYTAPSGTQGVQRAIVLTYSLDDDGAGIAIAHVTIESSP